MIREFSESPYIPLTSIKTKFISTGIDSLDYCFNGLQSGTVTTITGRSGEGKSTVAHGILLQAINDRKKALIIDGEHHRDNLYRHLFRQVIGNDKSLYRVVKRFIRDEFEPKQPVLDLLNKWFKDKLYTSMKYETELMDFEQMYKEFYLACKTKDIDLVIFDNLMSLVDSTSIELNSKQSKFMKMIDSLAKAANVVVILVAHVNGSAQKGMEIDYYQISGSSDLVNLSTNIFQVIKNPIEHLTGDIQPDGRIKVLKGREYGEEPRIDLHYDKLTGALCEQRGGSYKVKTYNWRMEGVQNELDENRFIGQQQFVL